MATAFPEALDVFVPPTKYDQNGSATVPLWQLIQNLQDAVLALETAMGATGATTLGESVKIQGGKLWALYADGLWYQILFTTVDAVRGVDVSDTSE